MFSGGHDKVFKPLKVKMYKVKKALFSSKEVKTHLGKHFYKEKSSPIQLKVYVKAIVV